jgi:hypothetical protein
MDFMFRIFKAQNQRKKRNGSETSKSHIQASENGAEKAPITKPQAPGKIQYPSAELQ